MNKIIIKRERNQKLMILKVLSIFRDKGVINSLQEISHFMAKYETENQIIVEFNKEKTNEIIKELDGENIQYSII